MKIIFAFFISSFIFFIIDFIWLSITVSSFYRPNLGNLLTEKPVFWAAGLFYIIYMIGLTLLVLKPSIDANSLFLALWSGVVFGVVCYGTYNLTNMATVKDWSPIVVLVDMIWGGTLTGSVAFLTTYFIKTFFNT